MVKIKLFRTGKNNEPRYRIVVTEARSKRNGKYTESLGWYNPETNPPEVSLDKAKYTAWVEKGAQPTLTVKSLFTKYAKKLEV